MFLYVSSKERTKQAHNVIKKRKEHRNNLQTTFSQSRLEQHTHVCERVQGTTEQATRQTSTSNSLTPAPEQ